MKLLKILKEWFAKLFSLARVDDPHPKGQSATLDMTSKKLMEDVVELFKRGIEQESVGDRMLYPMSFYVLMHKDDYESRKKALPFLVPEIIKAFYKIILEKKGEYPNCEPVSKKWVFQFSPCQLDSSIETEDKDVFTIKKGNIISTSELYNDSIDTFKDMLVERDVKVSIKCNNSNVIKTANLNLQALAGVDILDEGFFAYKFDDKLLSKTEIVSTGKTPLPPEPEPVVDNAPLATISYVNSGKTYKYTMRFSPLYISGKRDTRTTSNVFKIENADIENGHVQIKYENGDFHICAFGDTRLNEKPMAKSEPGNIKWQPLANNSDILMNEDIQINFKKV